MERELAGSSVQLKLKSKWDSPLISIYEFCYAAGMELALMSFPKERFEELKSIEKFEEFHKAIIACVSDSDSWKGTLNGEKLHHLIMSYRIQEELNEDARFLFEMGFQA